MDGLLMKERRQSPRYAARHLAPVRLIDPSPDASQRVVILTQTPIARTYNISDSGLMLEMHDVEIDRSYFEERNFGLRVVLAIPPEPVEIYGLPVRYEQNNRSDYILGVQITKMNEMERSRYLAYVQELKRLRTI
jgi:hypothetical protein